MAFFSTKTYGHDVGLSACFRQHLATHSHCSKLHGYALAVSFMFGCHQLDDRNWVQDFGDLKEVKQFLQDHFDHKVIVAEDDPQIQLFFDLDNTGMLDVIVMPGVGCEKFAEFIYIWVAAWLDARQFEEGSRVWLESVEVKEHGANSAIYKKD